MDKVSLFEKLKQIENLAKECISGLNYRSGAQKTIVGEKISDRAIDFEIPIRAFIKKYSKGLSGPKKFTLLVACLSKGDLKKEIPLDVIEKNWNKMKSRQLLSMEFNRGYSLRAIENNWVEPKKYGVYSLRPLWKGIFK